jgi:uncharacterized protein YprB with RNaseH-like and TPR domain
MAKQAPVSRLKKAEIVWLSAHKCRHSHTYLEHYACYLEECPERGRIGFFDIETSNLKANVGVLLSYAIKDNDSNEVLGRVITKKELFSDSSDKKIVQECQNDLMKFDIIVTYYGTRFDIPFVRTRAIYHGLEFPAYGEIVHTDLYYIVRNKFCLTSNKLVVACVVLLGDSSKTDINYELWFRAAQGRKDALDYVWEHNQADVIDTGRLYHRVIPFKKRMDLSA